MTFAIIEIENDNEIQQDNENYKTCDYICFILQIFIISGLIFFIFYFLYFLFRMIEIMSFKIRYD
jgi:hypothetical protein